MPANVHLMSGLGAGGEFRPAQSCPVAGSLGSGAYMSHQGDEDSYMIADASTRDGRAAIRIVLWRCVYCGTLMAGLGRADCEPRADQEFTWLEQKIVQLAGDSAEGPGSGGPGDPRPGT
jgi:hypothetical protein